MEGKILSFKSRDQHNNDGTCLHKPHGICPVWSQWEDLLDDVEEYLRKRDSLENQSTSLSQKKFEFAIGVVERIAKVISLSIFYLLILSLFY